MRRDRTGEVIEDDEPSVVHACVRGWLEDDRHGRPVPCPTCKPWLVDPRVRVPVLKRRRRSSHNKQGASA